MKTMDIISNQMLRDLYQSLPDLWLQHISGELPWDKQREIMQAVVRHPRVAVASANGCGKTFIAARTGVWWLRTYRPSILITTAPTDRQVNEILWREMRVFAAKARAHGHPLGGKLLLTSKWDFGENHFAIGFSTKDNDAERFQGFHFPHILVIADEAAGISEKIFEGITATLKGAHTRLLAIGNPTALDGWFYQAFKSPGWWSTHISAFDSPNVQQKRIVVPGLVTQADIVQAREDYGEDSPVWQSRILGQFPDRLDNTIIALRLVEEAGLREPKLEGDVVIGADIARGGSDSTVFVARRGMNAFAAEEYHKIDTMESAGRLAKFSRKVGATRVQVDVVGLGAGVVDRLRELMPELDVVEMGAGQSAHDDEHYANAGAEWYAATAEVLRDGRAGGPVFKNRRVIGDLTSRKWRMRSDGRFELEPKHEILKRGGRSPDWGDAIAMCFAPPPRDRVAEFINVQIRLNSKTQQHSAEAASPKYVLNRQTHAIEFKPAVKKQPVISDKPQTTRRKTLIEVYNENRNRLSFDQLGKANDPCKICGKPVGITRVEDGVDAWHQDCVNKRW